MPSIKELHEKRANLVTRLRELAERSEGDDWTPADEANWLELNQDYDQTREACDAAVAAESRTKRLEEIREREERARRDFNPAIDPSIRSENEPGATHRNFGGDGGGLPLADRTRALALQAFLRGGRRMSDEHREACRAVGINARDTEIEINFALPSYPGGLQMFSSSNGAAVINRGLMREGFATRDMGTGANVGGETIPEGFLYELENKMVAFGGLRRVARILRTASGNDIPMPNADDTGNTGELLAEGADVGASTDAATDAAILRAFKFSSKPILASAELLQDSAFNMAMEIAGWLGTRIGRAQAGYFATGTGTSQPEGIINCDKGIDAALNTAIASDEYIDLQHSVDESYRGDPSTAFAMNDKTLAAARKLKDGQGNYLWQPDYTQGAPDRLVGWPVAIDHQLPDIGASAIPVVAGPMSKFVIRDAGTVRFYRLDELYRATDQTGFLAFLRSDSRLNGSGHLKHLLCPA